MQTCESLSSLPTGKGNLLNRRATTKNVYVPAAETLGPTAYKKVMDLLSSLLNFAHRQGYIPTNRARDLRSRLGSTNKDAKPILLVHELRKLVFNPAAKYHHFQIWNAIQESYKTHDTGTEVAEALGYTATTVYVYHRKQLEELPLEPWWVFTVLGLYLGARPVELLELKWEDIHWKTGNVSVKNGKNGAGHLMTSRLVPICKEFAPLLHEIQRRSRSSREYILPDCIKNGAVTYQARGWRTWIEPFIENSEDYAPYTLRRTFACLMVCSNFERH